jgi:hypothetical protein
MSIKRSEAWPNLKLSLALQTEFRFVKSGQGAEAYTEENSAIIHIQFQNP